MSENQATTANPSFVKKSLKELFNLPDAKQNPLFEIPAVTHELVPAADHCDPNYQFVDYVLLGNFLRWVTSKTVRDAFMLQGPFGTGKSQFALNAFNRLNMPVVYVKCDSSMDRDDLFGHRVLENGATPFVPGPAVIAAEQGMTLILEEFHLLDPQLFASLNPMIERVPFYFKELGRNIKFAPGFKVMLLGNNGGLGDETGAYAGSNIHNIATLDRVECSVMKYLAPDLEQSILAADMSYIADPNIREQLAKTAVQLANAMRCLNLGNMASQYVHPDALKDAAVTNATNTKAGASIEVSMSLRGLKRFMRIMAANSNIGSRIPGEQAHTFALSMAVTGIASTETRMACGEICTLLFGSMGTP